MATALQPEPGWMIAAVAGWAATALVLVWLLIEHRSVRDDAPPPAGNGDRPGRIWLWRGWTDRSGAAAVEFALLLPVLTWLLIGILTWGGWLWLAQSVEALAGQGARAAVAGLDDAERVALAEGEIAAQAPRLTGLDMADLDLAVQTEGHRIRVSVGYDLTGHPFMALAELTVSPPSRIERSAVVRTGGY